MMPAVGMGRGGLSPPKCLSCPPSQKLKEKVYPIEKYNRLHYYWVLFAIGWAAHSPPHSVGYWLSLLFCIPKRFICSYSSSLSAVHFWAVRKTTTLLSLLHLSGFLFNTAILSIGISLYLRLFDVFSVYGLLQSSRPSAAAACIMLCTHTLTKAMPIKCTHWTTQCCPHGLWILATVWSLTINPYLKPYPHHQWFTAVLLTFY